MSEQTPVPATFYAVIQSGGVTSESDIVSYVDSEGKRRPSVLFMSDDKEKCVRMAKRILNRYNKIRKFADPKNATLTPILGVVPVVLEPVKARNPKADKPATNGQPVQANPSMSVPPAERAKGPATAKK